MKAEEMNEVELRQLDAFCAEKVMGWKRGWSSCAPRGFECHEKNFEYYGLWVDPLSGTGKRAYLFHPTKDEAAAFGVFVELGAYAAQHLNSHILYSKNEDEDHWFGVWNGVEIIHQAEAETPQLALCLLAKKIYSEQK